MGDRRSRTGEMMSFCEPHTKLFGKCDACLRDALAAVEAERDALKAHNADVESALDEVTAERDALRHEVERLRLCPDVCYGCSARVATLEAVLREAREAMVKWLEVVVQVSPEHLPAEHHPGEYTFQFHNRALDAIDTALGAQQGKGEP